MRMKTWESWVLATYVPKYSELKKQMVVKITKLHWVGDSMPLNKRRQMGVSLNCSQKISQEEIVSFFSVYTPAELLLAQPLVFNLYLLYCSLNACLTLPNPQSTRFTIIYFPVHNILALFFAVFILLVCQFTACVYLFLANCLSFGWENR